MRKKEKVKSRGRNLPYVAGAAYAASDEWHQTMVPGRSGSVEDVLIDAAGIVVGVLAAMGIVWLIKKRIKKRMIE